MNFDGRFRDMAGPGDDLVGIAPAETTENGLLSLGQLKLRDVDMGTSVLDTRETVVGRNASRLLVEERALLLEKAAAAFRHRYVTVLSETWRRSPS